MVLEMLGLYLCAGECLDPDLCSDVQSSYSQHASLFSIMPVVQSIDIGTLCTGRAVCTCLWHTAARDPVEGVFSSG